MRPPPGRDFEGAARVTRFCAAILLISGGKMRAAAILGPGASPKDLQQFQDVCEITQVIEISENLAADAILLFGGDGTVHRHLAQVVKAQRPVLVIPCGSGNDFARALGMRNTRSAHEAWSAYVGGRKNVRTVDLGTITHLDLETGPPRETAKLYYFCTVAGVGLDGEIARRANRLPRWLLGRGGYALSLPGALLFFRAFNVKISLAAPYGACIRDQPAFLAAFANAPAYGGGMKIAPRARIDDGLLDICLIRKINKFKLLALFPTVYAGRHLAVREVDYFQSARGQVETDPPLDVYADGEYVCRTPVEIGMARRALRVIVP